MHALNWDARGAVSQLSDCIERIMPFVFSEESRLGYGLDGLTRTAQSIVSKTFSVTTIFLGLLDGTFGIGPRWQPPDTPKWELDRARFSSMLSILEFYGLTVSLLNTPVLICPKLKNRGIHKSTCSSATPCGRIFTMFELATKFCPMMADAMLDLPGIRTDYRYINPIRTVLSYGWHISRCVIQFANRIIDHTDDTRLNDQEGKMLRLILKAERVRKESKMKEEPPIHCFEPIIQHFLSKANEDGSGFAPHRFRHHDDFKDRADIQAVIARVTKYRADLSKELAAVTLFPAVLLPLVLHFLLIP